MIRIFMIICLMTLMTGVSHSQSLKGKITNESGEPVPYSTVYIQELKQGTTANTKGDYELKLPSGKYSVTYQSLGFAPVYYNITLTEGTVIKNVVLPVQYYEIPEVRITATGEDPAYNIIRKSIGMAPYYLNYINHYKAEVYIKGNLIFNKIPKLVQRSIRIESEKEPSSRESGIKEGVIYLMESFNEIEFTAPDRYFQRVISVNSTFPDQGDNISPMDIIKASFYQPVLADIAISPLSPQAFSYYKFKYMGATLQGNNTVNKIQVIPKMKSQQLFEGFIYIIEDLWCLHSVDLTNDNIAGKLSIEQLYIPVQDHIWLPVSLKFDMEISILGFRADAGYGSSLKYTGVEVNKTLKKPGQGREDQKAAVSYTVQAGDQVVFKNQEKIEKILEKDKLSNRDMVTMARLMKKESEKKLPDTTRNDLEIKDNTTRIVEKDATKKDSSYWAEIRPIPLSDAEMRSIRVRDSVTSKTSAGRLVYDSIPVDQPEKKSRMLNAVKKVATGHTWSDTSGFRLVFDGLLDPSNLRFNPVDGFTYGLDLRLSGSFSNNSDFYFDPGFYYAFSRARLMWRINGGLNFKSFNTGTIFFRTGVMSKDIGNAGSINYFLNSITSLFLKENYLKLYESGYFIAGIRKNVANGLRIELSAGYENRKSLENSTDFSFFRRRAEYTDNIPDNFYLSEGSDPLHAVRDQKHYEFVTNIVYTPRQRYKISNNVRIPQGSDWPVFSLTWKHGLNEPDEPSDRYSHFDMFRFESSKKHNTGAFSELSWRVKSGWLLNNSKLSFYDFFHFNSQPFPVLLNDYQDAFRLPAYYSLSTPELFGELHLKYTTPYLILKYLPGISKTLMRENLSISWLGSLNRSIFTELGYSITELFLLGEAGIFTGFDNFKYRCTGFRFVLKFD